MVLSKFGAHLSSSSIGTNVSTGDDVELDLLPWVWEIVLGYRVEERRASDGGLSFVEVAAWREDRIEPIRRSTIKRASEQSVEGWGD